ncbi:MAG: UDP-N-acetylmuramoyl-L-alanine--D-glutamate ligase [Candidatus Pacebacteria bacterium]|nr:UDP-N-acetylmuramoyl-L-alanine--D-glutamate ligase [Candidatus Paceibacterota bacterium]
MKTENLIRPLAEKKILILGFGQEGIDTYLALRKLFPAKFLGIADKKNLKEFDKATQKILLKDRKLKLFFGKDYLSKIGEHDLIIKAPGISGKELSSFHNGRSFAPSSAVRITSQTEIFFDNFPGLIVGITGTKGKGTTASLTYEILKKAGLKVYLGGNIGKPVLQYLLKAKPSDIFVYELSSHQLQSLKKSPQIAVFLNLFQDHLDYYKNFTEYQKAKTNIIKYQTKNDYLIFNGKDRQVLALSKKAKAQKIDFSCDSKYYKTLLTGKFNQFNIKAAVGVAELFKIPNKVMLQVIKNFRGLPHRLEFVGEFRGIKFYNNSMATIPQATILDLQTFNDRPISLIIGGSDKGNDYANLCKEITKTSVKNLIILGQGTGQKILEGVNLLPKRKEIHPFLVNSMQEAIQVCFEKTPIKGVCLLSPASASFNIFKNYQERGNQFKKFAKLYEKT